MNILRGLLTFILSFILTILLFSYSIIVPFKNIIENQLLTESIQNMVSNKVGEFDEEKVAEAIEDKQVSDMVNSFFDDYKKMKEDGTFEISDETLDSIIDYIVANEEAIEKYSDTDLDLEEIKSKEYREELRSNINSAVNDLNNEDNVVASNVFGTYMEVTAEENLMKLLIIIVVIALLIIIISWSPYKWLSPIGISLIVSGSWVTLVYLSTSVLAKVFEEALDFDVKLDTSMILIFGAGELISGIAALILKSVLKKSFNKKSKINIPDTTEYTVEKIENKSNTSDNQEEKEEPKVIEAKEDDLYN